MLLKHCQRLKLASPDHQLTVCISLSELDDNQTQIVDLKEKPIKHHQHQHFLVQNLKINDVLCWPVGDKLQWEIANGILLWEITNGKLLWEIANGKLKMGNCNKKWEMGKGWSVKKLPCVEENTFVLSK